ncbi:MAG: MFS transporter [Oscillospiraceae bacterium]|nr:MFS transporter [Oscillospiraceae bacterium]
MRTFLTKLEVAPKNQGLWGIMNFAFLVNGVMVIMLGVLLPYIKVAHDLSYTQTGFMFSMHQLGTFCAVLIAGVLPYMIGRKPSILLLSAGAVFGLVLIVFTQNLLLLIVAFGLTGVTRGALNNTCNVTIVDISGNRTASMNVLHSAFAFGALVSPVIVLLWTFATGSIGWMVAALTAAVLVAITWALIARTKLPALPPKKEKGGSLSFLREVKFWIPTILLFLYIAVETSIIGWFVLYFVDVGTLPRGLAGLVPTIHWLMMAIGRISIAIAADRIRRKNRALVIMGLATTFCFVGMLLSTASAVISVVFLLGIGLSMAGIYPTTVATMKDAASSVALGFTVAIAGLGGILMPSIIGVVADAHGITTGISLVLAGALLMVLLAVFKVISERSISQKTDA